MTFQFQEQARYFAKKINLPTESYLDIQGEEHDYFFVVAGANRNEIVDAFRQAVDNAIEQGATLAQFRKDFDEIVDNTGWQYKGGRNWRTRIIYDTNVYGAYNRGRLKQHLELADVLPYWEYQHNDNAHPRQAHVDLDGTIRPASDPFWKYYYPIKAYGCHCTVIAHDEADLKNMSKTVSPPVEIEYQEKWVGVRVGNPRIVNLPKGYDVGFAPHNFENLKQDRLDSVDKLLMQKHVTSDPKFTAAMVGDLLERKEIAQIQSKSVKSWISQIDSAQDDKAMRYVENLKLLGVLPVKIIEKLEKLNIAPQSAIIAMEKGDLKHALRELKDNFNIAVPLSFWEQIADKLKHPKAILLEKQQETPTLLFIYEIEKTKLAIKINYDATLFDRINGKRNNIKLNRIITGSLFKDTTGLKSSLYELLEGSL
ncbi:phage head morphogenesis protein [Pasteurellaceae bacterium 22721_9_1]